jgi:uncharacterized protein
MVRTTASVPTSSGSKYIQQLCKHWAHKLEVTLDEGRGTVRFQGAVATMDSSADRLAVTIEAENEALLVQMKDVVARHLNRFAFREAPLTFDWRREVEGSCS